MSTPPPDHYLTLGVSKDAKLPEIRSAHRKLVLKCHPDKVQDAALKAAKQDEFQKVQAAYEVLSDDTRRLQYNEQVKLFELRREMGRGNPTARSNPFEYEIRTAEPRANSYARPKPAQPSPKVYSHTPPRSYEDVVYEEPRVTSRKSATYEPADRKRPSAKDEERRRNEEDERERARQRAEKESRRAAHGEKKKSRDKERRRGTEEKHSRVAGVFVVDEDDEDEYRYASRSSEKKTSRHRLDEDIRLQREREDMAREAARATIKSAPLDPKWDKHMDFAGQYMQAARRKVAPAEEDSFRPSPLRRAETLAATSTSASYTVRHVAPQFSDDDSPRRSSAHKESRKSAEAPPSRTRDRSGRDRRSPPAASKEPYIVEPPSPPPPTRKPTLQTHTSAPPNLPYLGRERPTRSQTQEYPRAETIPPLSRAQTFQTGDGSRERASGSRLKQPVAYSSDESDSDAPPNHGSYSPPSHRAREPTRYIIDNGRAKTVPRHRSELRDIDDERVYPRDRSESPHGAHRSQERPPTSRARTSERSRAIPIRSASYYTPDPPEPIIHTVRPPKGSPRDSSHRTSSRGGGPFFGDVKFAPSYGAEHIIYSQHPADIYRRGSDPSSQGRDHYAHQRGGSGREVYA